MCRRKNGSAVYIHRFFPCCSGSPAVSPAARRRRRISVRRRFSRYHEKEMSFPNADEAKYWLIRVVKNAALNYAKRKERERRAYQRAFREADRKSESGEGDLLRKETRREVTEALARLPEKFRMVLVLKEYGELNYREIGRALGISEGNVKVRVFRARERLAALLGEAGTDFPGAVD